MSTTPNRSLEAVSNVDTAWLRMEHPSNLMMITAILVFDEIVSAGDLAELLTTRLLRFKRFKQRIRKSASLLKNPSWEEHPEFHIDNHISVIELPENAESNELNREIDRLISTPLEMDFPLWQVTLINRNPGGTVLLVRIHHCIGDGTALVRVLLSLTDQSPNQPSQPNLPKTPVTKPKESGTRISPLVSVAEKAWRFGSLLLKQGRKTVQEPQRLLDFFQMGAKGAAALGTLALRSSDPQTRLKGKLQPAKSAVWGDPIPLQTVKDLGKRVGATVNDILMTAMTGALRRYLEHHQDPIQKLNLRAAVPVNLRPPSDTIELGNYFGLVFPSLPIGIEEPQKRLDVLRSRMNALKTSPEAMLTLGALNAAAIAPEELQKLIVNFLGAKTSLVMTNVPGPKDFIYLTGKKIKKFYFWVPQSGMVGLGVSIFSYAGDVFLGIASDKGLIPDPEQILLEFQEEFKFLEQRLGKN